MRKLLSLALALIMVLSMASVAVADEPIKLTLWGSELQQDLLAEMVEGFKAANPDKTFDITIGALSESIAKDTILTDIEAAADVFAFADDQLKQLVDAGALQPVLLNTDAVIEANGGAESGSVKAASVDGTLYAYPMTASNGYFMFYDKSVFTEEDVQTMDKMLEVAAAAGKQITMTFDSGWYLYSWFKGAGLEAYLLDDGKNNFCNWNATDTPYTGVQVAEGILNVTSHPGFIALSDAEFQSGIKAGTIVAGVNGTWNATVAEEAWGENYAAVKLPTYTVNGEQVQMSSYAGYKLVGVNAYSKEVGYAMMLAEYITNEQMQVRRFEATSEGPSNVVAASSEAVKANPAIAALSAQSAFATVQRIGDNYWTPSESLGTILALGNPDGTDLQTLLDNAVIGITAPIVE